MRATTVSVLGLLLCTGPAAATVHVAIDLTHQRMHVTSSSGSYDWPISSARSGFSTPGGSFAPLRLERMHYSKKYHMSPMPYSIFFRGGFAIHGSYETRSLGRPASHGCVRLSPGNAATLYRMVESEGARISISGRPPASRPFPHEHGSSNRIAGGGRAPVNRRFYGGYDDGMGAGYGYGYDAGDRPYMPAYGYDRPYYGE